MSTPIPSSQLVRVVKKEVADLPFLMRLVLRYIYEKEKMSIAEIHLMQYSIVGWKQKIEHDRTLGRVLEEHEYQLQKMGELLEREERDGFQDRKKRFKEHNIDWRKFHRLPEAYTLEDFVRAQREYEKWCLANPEDAGLV